MATLRTYKCDCCGYEVQSEPLGHYSLMMGEFYNFSCPKCKEIVSIAAQILAAKDTLSSVRNAAMTLIYLHGIL